MGHVNKLLAACVVALAMPGLAGAQEILKEISSQRLEDLLKGMNIQYTKGTGDKGLVFYDYKSKNIALRLTNFSGKDLMIDVVLVKTAWDEINRWNGNAKFSRARLHKDKTTGVETTVLESNLDLTGGVTEETIKHFIRSFDIEVATWAKSAPAPVATEEEILKDVSNATLERVLNDLKITFKKAQAKGNNTFTYDFERNNLKVRLSNFNNQDVMIDCIYSAAPLSKVNQWNLKNSFVRAVLYPGNNSPYTALESNLDCSAGISENMLRYFITSFDARAADFDAYLKN